MSTTILGGEWLQYQLPSAVVMNYYQLASYINLPDKEQPYSWTLLASNNGASWTTLDTRSMQTYYLWENNSVGPTHYRTFSINNNTTAYQYYRLIITSTDPEANQIGMLTLYAFNLISGGSMDQDGFLIPGSGGTVFPEETLTSSNQNGYITTQSDNWFYSAEYSEPPLYRYYGLYVLSANRGQTFGSIDTYVYIGLNYYKNAITLLNGTTGYNPLYTAPIIPGEWLQMSLPSPIILSYVQIAAPQFSSPYEVIIAGSIDGIFWVPIVSATDNVNLAYHGITSYLTIICNPTTQMYRHYRIIFPVGDIFNRNTITILGCNLISGGMYDENGFFPPNSGATIHPTQVMTSSQQAGYTLTQSSGFNVFLDENGSISDGWHVLTKNRANQTIDSILNTQVMMYSYGAIYSIDGYYMGSIFTPIGRAETTIQIPLQNPICFLEGSKILCFNTETNQEEYRAIETIRKGTLVKTLVNGYKPVDMIGTSKLYNPGNKKRSKNRLYRLPTTNYPELSADLFLTGCHSILVKDLTKDQRRYIMAMQGETYVTDKHYRLIACADARAEPYAVEGLFSIWHLALEHDDQYMNYGIYANGLLVETTSKRMLRDLSGMDLV
jgi:hypothetical protein